MEVVSADWVRLAWDIFQTLVLLFIAVYTWMVNRSKANTNAIDAVEDRVKRNEERLSLLEREVQHMPDHNDLSQLYEKVNTVNSSMQEVKGNLAGINRTLALINQHLMGGNKEK